MKVLVGTKQFKMVIDEELIDRLRSAANKAGRDSAQHLAEEILTIYLPVYNAVLDATRRAVAYQTEQIASEAKPLAPVVATITPAEVRKMVGLDEPAGTRAIPIMKKKAG